MLRPEFESTPNFDSLDFVDPIGPDVEIEHFGRMYEVQQKIKPEKKHPSFEQFILMNSKNKSNEWAYVSNRLSDRNKNGHNS